MNQLNHKRYLRTLESLIQLFSSPSDFPTPLLCLLWLCVRHWLLGILPKEEVWRCPHVASISHASQCSEMMPTQGFASQLPPAVGRRIYWCKSENFRGPKTKEHSLKMGRQESVLLHGLWGGAREGLQYFRTFVDLRVGKYDLSLDKGLAFFLRNTVFLMVAF